MIDIDRFALTLEKLPSGDWRITSDTPELHGLDHTASTLHEALSGISNAVHDVRIKAS